MAGDDEATSNSCSTIYRVECLFELELDKMNMLIVSITYKSNEHGIIVKPK